MSWINEVINDTLKRPGADGKLKWSRTSLTMASAWLVVLWSYIHFTIKDGFNETSFSIMVGVALGVKVTDAWSKKINPTNGNTGTPS